MITDFINSKLKDAAYRILGDGTYFGEIRGVKGVWANTNSLEECREELKEVLEDWLVVKIRAGERVSGFSSVLGKRRMAYA
ncbi:MAG: type II toxin-antitoxin system HicB family antitoxin [Candidatus Paceibacterota bacterium]|jgi:predicted RNase H-like HicB family nuclease